MNEAERLSAKPDETRGHRHILRIFILRIFSLGYFCWLGKVDLVFFFVKNALAFWISGRVPPHDPAHRDEADQLVHRSGLPEGVQQSLGAVSQLQVARGRRPHAAR